MAHRVVKEIREALEEEAERLAYCQGRPRWEARGVGVEVGRQETIVQADLLRDMFPIGSPIQPNAIKGPFSKIVLQLAEAVYHGDTGSIAPLHDALLEANHSELAEHFRKPHHPRGCWLIDVLLGKTDPHQ
jgi:hypothetical protein